MNDLSPVSTDYVAIEIEARRLRAQAVRAFFRSLVSGLSRAQAPVSAKNA